MRKAVIDDFMHVGVVLALLFSAISLSAQDIRITRQADRPFEEVSMAKLEFVSNSDKLEFNENTGVEMSRSEMRAGTGNSTSATNHTAVSRKQSPTWGRRAAETRRPTRRRSPAET